MEEKQKLMPFLEILAIASCFTLAITTCTSPFYNPSPKFNKTISYVMYQSRVFRALMTFATASLVFLNYWHFTFANTQLQNFILKLMSLAMAVLWIIVIVTGWGWNHYIASVSFTALAFIAYMTKFYFISQQAIGTTPYAITLVMGSIVAFAVSILGAVFMALNSEHSEAIEYAVSEHALLFNFALGTACLQLCGFDINADADDFL